LEKNGLQVGDELAEAALSGFLQVGFERAGPIDQLLRDPLLKGQVQGIRVFGGGIIVDEGQQHGH
jgi:hypothetical protein